MKEDPTPSVQQRITEIFNRIGHEGINERIEQLYVSFLCDADLGGSVYSCHWENYQFVKELKELFKQARDEFDLKH